MNENNECVFCNIINNKQPSFKLYENDEVVAFLSIFPINTGHVLVIPKDHIENMYGIPDETLCRVSIVVKKIAIAVKHAVDADGVNVVQNNESAAGQEIDHLHFHVIPRFKDDGLVAWPHKNDVSKEELKTLQEKIKVSIEN